MMLIYLLEIFILLKFRLCTLQIQLASDKRRQEGDEMMGWWRNGPFVVELYVKLLRLVFYLYFTRKI